MAEPATPAGAREGRGILRLEDSVLLARLRQVNLTLLFALPLAILVSRAAADGIVIAVGLSLLFASVKSRYWGWLREPPVAIAFVLWGFANIVVSPFAVDAWDSFSRSLPWIRFVLFYAAVTTWLVTGERQLRLIGWWMAAVVALVAVDTLAQHVTGVSLSGQKIAGRRLTGILDRPNIGILLARFGFPAFALLAWLCSRRTDRWSIAVSVAVFALAMSTIFLTGERAATLLSLIALAVLLVWVFVSAPRLRGAAVLLFLALAGAVTAAVAFDDRIQARALKLVVELANFGESNYGQIFAVAFRAFADDPLTGIGLKNFRLVCPQYEALGIIRHCVLHAHNIYLEWLAEGGAVAFALFVALVASLFVGLWRRVRGGAVNPVTAGFLTGALLVSFFPFTASQSFFANWPAVLLWFSVALAMASARTMARMPDGRTVGENR